MTDIELERKTNVLRKRTGGSTLHIFWDTIFDAEDHLNGRGVSVGGTPFSREEVERMVQKYIDISGGDTP